MCGRVRGTTPTELEEHFNNGASLLIVISRVFRRLCRGRRPIVIMIWV